MKNASIRWWLPLSYGAIAFITAVALGLVLLLALKSYYTWQERRYLEDNVAAISGVMEQLLDADATDFLQSQIDTYAYLTQTQIELFDNDGKLLASSQNPGILQAAATFSLQIDTGDSRQELSQTVDASTDEPEITSFLLIEADGGRFASESSVSGDIGELGTVDGFVAPLLNIQTPNSFGLGTAAPEQRSAQVVSRVLGGRLPGVALGMLQLSKGPAFGQAILRSVAVGIAVAGGVAVLLATVVGWWMSQRINQPIHALVTATEQMATGDLTVRSDVDYPEELGKLAQSFNTMAGRIEQTISTLRHFVADAAHELNTPLTSLRTNLELAERAQPENVYLVSARSQALRLQQLNDDLLRLSRLESGIDQAEMRQLDLTQLLATCSERYAAQAEQAGIVYNLTLPPAPALVQAHEEALVTVLDNVIDNALKFTPAPGSVVVALSLQAAWVTLTVNDTGIGIVPEDAGLIYGRFHRGQNAAELPGSGLGLAIVKTIVESYGGTITLVPQTIGAHFVVQLPSVS